MRFVLLVEGMTEKLIVAAFLKRWLDPRLNHSVGIRTEGFEGWAELVKDLPRKVPMYLNDPARGTDIIAVIALLDLYGLQLPNQPDAESMTKRYEWAKSYLELTVNNPRFRQYFAVHELEAWLFSKPDIFRQDILNRFPKNLKQPEEINFSVPPAKLLDNTYMAARNQHYLKPRDGKILFAKLDPNVAYEKCPYLRLMLDDMLQMAKDAGL